MKRTLVSCLLVVGGDAVVACAQPALTVYNENFAVVRDTVPLDLPAGTTAAVRQRLAEALDGAPVSEDW